MTTITPANAPNAAPSMAGSLPAGFLLGAVTGVPLGDAPEDEVALAERVEVGDDVGLFEVPGGGDWVDVPVRVDVALFETPGGGDCVGVPV